MLYQIIFLTNLYFDYNNDGFDYMHKFVVMELYINKRIETKIEIVCVFLLREQQVL